MNTCVEKPFKKIFGLFLCCSYFIHLVMFVSNYYLYFVYVGLNLNGLFLISAFSVGEYR